MFKQEHLERQMKIMISQMTHAISNGEIAASICGNNTVRCVILENMETNKGDTVNLARRIVYGANINIHQSYVLYANVELNDLLCAFAKNVDSIVRNIVKNHGLDVEAYIIESYYQNLKLLMEA